jgi:large subunit ribosomal protein L14
MIQKETYLNIIDNSGVKKVSCIHVYGGYRKRYAISGDIILASVKSIKTKKNEESKFKKGDITKVLILYTKALSKSFYSNHKKHYENAGILISNSKKIVGSRIFGSVDSNFRYSKFLKVLTLSNGIYK